MSEMWMPPSGLSSWEAVDFALVFIMWAVMMAAMMLPSAIPMVLAFSRVCRQQNHAGSALTFLFVLAYWVAWLGFSLILTLLQWQFHRLAWLSPMMDQNSPLLASVILFLAGAYQFMPLKNACLNHCRTPMGFLLNEWRAGKKGAFKMGLKHGVTCIGCCWAQMMIMFAVGVMNILGMALITLLVIMEKMAPVNPVLISRFFGVGFVLWGGYFLSNSH